MQYILGMQEAIISCTAMLSTTILTKDTNGKDRQGTWYYRLVIGMLIFLANSAHLEIAFAAHQ